MRQKSLMGLKYYNEHKQVQIQVLSYGIYMKESLHQSLEKTKNTPSKHEFPREVIEALVELEPPLLSMLNDLRNEIEHGEYKIIIGDDASGRIPTLIFGEVIKKRYKEKGFDLPRVYFITGSSNLFFKERVQKEELVTAYVEKLKKKREIATTKDAGKILVVTEAIASGRSVCLLMAALKNNKLKADVATVGLRGGKEVQGRLEKEWDTKIVYGMERTPKIYLLANKGILGVVTKEARKLFAEPYKTSSSNFFDTISDAQNFINKSREIAHEIADRLFKEYKKTAK